MSFFILLLYIVALQAVLWYSKVDLLQDQIKFFLFSTISDLPLLVLAQVFEFHVTLPGFLVLQHSCRGVLNSDSVHSETNSVRLKWSVKPTSTEAWEVLIRQKQSSIKHHLITANVSRKDITHYEMPRNQRSACHQGHKKLASLWNVMGIHSASWRPLIHDLINS